MWKIVLFPTLINYIKILMQFIYIIFAVKMGRAALCKLLFPPLHVHSSPLPLSFDCATRSLILSSLRSTLVPFSDSASSLTRTWISPRFSPSADLVLLFLTGCLPSPVYHLRVRCPTNVFTNNSYGLNSHSWPPILLK